MEIGSASALIRPVILCMVLSILSLTACQQFPPPAYMTQGNRLTIVTTGAHLPVSDEYWEKVQESIRTKQNRRAYAVWATSSAAANMAIEMFRERGNVMVEPARVSEVLDQQQIRLTRTNEDDIHILRAAKLTGAERVLFLDVSEHTEMWSRHGLYDQNTGYGAVYLPSVAVRAVDIESHEVRWSGQATLSKPLLESVHPKMIGWMTRAAIIHATCFTERGYKLVQDGAVPFGTEWGCIKKE